MASCRRRGGAPLSVVGEIHAMGGFSVLLSWQGCRVTHLSNSPPSLSSSFVVVVNVAWSTWPGAQLAWLTWHGRHRRPR